MDSSLFHFSNERNMYRETSEDSNPSVAAMPVLQHVPTCMAALRGAGKQGRRKRKGEKGRGGPTCAENGNRNDFIVKIVIFFSFPPSSRREKSRFCQWNSQRVAGKVARRPKYNLINSNEKRK